jgi:deazaflavin-dependent oxidoreductase (nitroreductase family)
MLRRTAVTASLVSALVLAVVVTWLRGMRDKDSRVVDWQRRVNRDRFNPRRLQTAGRPGDSTAVIRHTGRRSGRSYETPVDVVRTDDGFVVGLVYGPRTDWARNVLAAGGAVVVHDGQEHEVGSPRLVDLDEVGEHYTAGELRVMRAFGVAQCLEVRRLP